MSQPEAGWFEAFNEALDQLEKTALAVLALGLVLFTVLLALNLDLIADQQEWATALLLWLLMLGASRAMASDSHPRLDLAKSLPPRWRVWLTRLMFALGSLIGLLLAMATLALVALEIRFEGEWAAGLPSWQVLLILPLGLAMLTARLAALSLAPSAWLSTGWPTRSSQP
ncbi:MAG: TRAP transporter small permease subunit [Wenzhouxiangella sp.]